MKRIFSGIQPSGVIHLGNYIGALRQWVDLQKPGNDCIYCVVDLHAITVRQNREDLRRNIFDTAALLLACGVDPDRSVLFVQSDVAEHSELAWILQCHTYMGELRRMTQFKEKARSGDDGAGAGLFSYPILMAADILLYDVDAVPVGEDQKQHLELTRDICQRFNSHFGETFKSPAPIIPSLGARVMSLDDPTKKMSKSNPNPSSYIALDDSPDRICKKLKSAVTDSGREIIFDEANKPAIANLISIFRAVSGLSTAEIEALYVGKGYGDFKRDLGDRVAEFLAPIQRNLTTLRANPDKVYAALIKGAERARELSGPKLAAVKDTLGLGARKDAARLQP